MVNETEPRMPVFIAVVEELSPNQIMEIHQHNGYPRVKEYCSLINVFVVLC